MSAIKIVFVTLHAEDGPQAVPLAAGCLAAALKADEAVGAVASVSLVDSVPGDDPKAIATRACSNNPDLIGFSLYSWNRGAAIEVAREIRSRGTKTPLLIVGGPEASGRPDGLDTAEGGPFDQVFCGEGEAAVVEFVRRLRGAEPRASAGTDFAALPSPWLDGTLRVEAASCVLWELTRGCPYACAYCYESKGDRRVRRLPDSRIEAELDLFAHAGVEVVFVLDPTFNADPARAKELLDLIARKAPNIHFHFEVRAEALDRGQAKRFAALGASLQIGLQTADPRVAQGIGRALNRGLFASKIQLLNEEGALFGLDLIYGLPGDSLNGFRASLDFALSLYPNNIDLFRLSVLPGTALAETAAALGVAHDAEAPYAVIRTPTFPEKDLRAAERLANAADYFYNRGRAVPWFNQVLHPLEEKPARFFEAFASFRERYAAPSAVSASRGAATDDPVAVERLQLAYLDSRYEEARLEHLLPAVWDIVRFHGAYARALAEGIETDIQFNYDPDEVTGADAMDLALFVEGALPHPNRCRMVVAPDGPRLVRRP